MSIFCEVSAVTYISSDSVSFLMNWVKMNFTCGSKCGSFWFLLTLKVIQGNFVNCVGNLVNLNTSCSCLLSTSCKVGFTQEEREYRFLCFIVSSTETLIPNNATLPASSHQHRQQTNTHTPSWDFSTIRATTYVSGCIKTLQFPSSFTLIWKLVSRIPHPHPPPSGSTAQVGPGPPLSWGF